MDIAKDLHNIYHTVLPSICDGTTYGVAFRKINDGDRVLEIGCATGYWGKYAKNHRDIDIYGLDIVEYHVEEARKLNCYTKVFKYDLNKLNKSMDRYNHRFDKIVMLDVIEHVYDPASVLRWCKEKLKPDGQIIISIPNIAHKEIIEQLLLDEFNYEMFGLLDRTHIRFFTLKTFTNLLEELGFEIIDLYKIMSDSNKYEDRIPKKIRDYINSLEESKAFQYVLTCGIAKPESRN